MYRVYHDPEGKLSLEQRQPTNSIFNKSIVSCTENEEAFKKRIEDLNEEIKGLNDELNMVNTIHLANGCTYVCAYN